MLDVDRWVLVEAKFYWRCDFVSQFVYVRYGFEVLPKKVSLYF